MKYHVAVEVHGDHVHLDLAHLPHELRPTVAAALQPLVKAAEPPDPRFREIDSLVDRIRATWERWTTKAAAAIAGLFSRGPKRAPAPLALEDELRRFEVGVLAATTGHTADPEIAQQLTASRDLPTTYALTAPVPTAVRHGMEVNPHAVADVQPARPDPAVREYTSAELATLAYARDRAAIFMRRPIEAAQRELREGFLDSGSLLDRSLTDHERALVAGALQDAIRGGLSVTSTAQRLRDAVAGTALTNDMLRVARTELAFAHHAGALASLRAKLAPGDDPLVYKTISPAACRECRRIWGDPRNPQLYRLSVVMVGNNFRLPAAQWGPTVGPSHPNCSCPPLAIWHPEVHDAVQDVAAQLAKVFGT